MKSKLILITLLIMSINFSIQAQKDPQKILIFLHEGVEILDFAGPMEVFIQAGFEVYTVGLKKEPLVAMGHLTVTPEYSVEDYPDPDIVTFFGGGGAATKSKDDTYKEHYLKMIEKADLQFSVCTGAYFLAESGLLNGHKATTFHLSTGLLQERYPKIKVLENIRFVDNGTVITTAGISAGIDGALHLVEKLKGKEVAKSVAFNMEYDKWVPGEGLIVENEFFAEAKKNGLERALEKYPKQITFKGDLNKLVDFQLAEKQWEDAIAIQQYIVDHHDATERDYQILGELFRKTGKKAPISGDQFLELVKEEKFEEAQKELEAAKTTFPDWMIYNGYTLNSLGYQYLSKQEYNKAIAIFKLNTIGYPNHWNTWDSLAEGYHKNGQKKLAIKYYEKSIALNPKNSFGKKMVEKLKRGTN